MEKKIYLSRNYFFAGTTAIVLINVLLFAFGGSGWANFVGVNATPSAAADFYRIIRSFLNCFAHESALKLFLTMMFFSVCGLYFERKTGSVKWVLLVSAVAFLSSMSTAANYFSLQWSGFSVAVCGLYAYIIIDYVFSFRKERKNRIDTAFDTAFGAAVIAFMYIALSFDGGVFWGYPHGLAYNLGHYSGFLAGLALGLTIQIFNLKGAGKTAWFAKNYLFAGTFTVVAANILLFAFGGNSWQHFIEINKQAGWKDFLYFNNTLRAFLNAFAHLDWVHVLSNMGGFFVCGIYLERKTGSCKLVLMVLALTFFTSIVSIASTFTAEYWIGFSGVLYLLYAYVAVDYLFSFRKAERHRLNIILGAAALALIYISMCFRKGVFVWYPYSLLFHEGHFFGFLAGLVLGLVIQLIKIRNSDASGITCKNNMRSHKGRNTNGRVKSTMRVDAVLALGRPLR